LVGGSHPSYKRDMTFTTDSRQLGHSRRGNGLNGLYCMTFPRMEILICKTRCSILVVKHSGVHTSHICTVCASLISSYRHASALNTIQGECRNTFLSPNAPLYTMLPRTSPYHTSNRIYTTWILAVLGSLGKGWSRWSPGFIVMPRVRGRAFFCS
jgi:hypothetical protein